MHVRNIICSSNVENELYLNVLLVSNYESLILCEYLKESSCKTLVQVLKMY